MVIYPNKEHICCIAALLLAGVVLFFCGCSVLQRTEMPHLPEHVPAAYEIENVPFFPQTDYHCGPATLAMALTASGLTITPDELKKEVYTPALRGSLQTDMIGAARRHGKIAYKITGPDSIFPEIAAGNPVIVLQNLGLTCAPVWHYALIIGYDFTKGIIILRSGVTERKVTAYGIFKKTWAHSNYWGIMVLKPGQIPVLAAEHDFLSAVLGLEKTRHFKAAVAGYQSALTRWPQSFAALMGLGNSYYAMGDLQSAEDAFRKAVRFHPQAGAAYNNLAQVLFEQGCKGEALQAARKAVAFGGPLSAVYEATLQEIQSK